MHPRGSASRPPAVLFNPFLFSPRALQRLFEFRVLPPFSSHRVETGSDPGMETRRERIFRNTRSDFNVGESETVRSFSKSNFFRKDEDRFDKNVPGPWMRRIGGKGGGRGGVFFRGAWRKRVKRWRIPSSGTCKRAVEVRAPRVESRYSNGRVLRMRVPEWGVEGG